MNTEELYNKTTEELYDEIVETLSSGNFLTLNGKPINLSELSDYINAQQQEIERLHSIIDELEKWIKKNNLGEYRTENVIDTDELLNKLQELKNKEEK